MDDKGQPKNSRDRGRVPSEERWDHYRRALRDQRGLVEAVYNLIAAEMFGHSIEQVANSTDFGASVLGRWHRQEDWNNYCAHETVSNSLFGQIMWTYFFDRSNSSSDEEWWSTYSNNGQRNDREERAYFLRRAKQVEAEPSPVPVAIDLNFGDRVKIKDGPFENFEGSVEEVIEQRGLVKVMLIIFNRPTPVDLEYWQVERI